MASVAERERRKKKKNFIKQMKLTAGNVAESCQRVGISRACFYLWKENDDEFATAISDIDEATIDYAETQLKKKIKEGDNTTLIFFLKTKGKKRGYTETQHIEHSGMGGGPIQIQHKLLVEFITNEYDRDSLDEAILKSANKIMKRKSLEEVKPIPLEADLIEDTRVRVRKRTV